MMRSPRCSRRTESSRLQVPVTLPRASQGWFTPDQTLHCQGNGQQCDCAQIYGKAPATMPGTRRASWYHGKGKIWPDGRAAKYPAWQLCDPFQVPRRVGRNCLHYRGTPGHRRAIPLIALRCFALVSRTLQFLFSERMYQVASTGLWTRASFLFFSFFTTHWQGESSTGTIRRCQCSL